MSNQDLFKDFTLGKEHGKILIREIAQFWDELEQLIICSDEIRIDTIRSEL